MADPAREQEHLAREAERLLQDETLADAMTAVRTDALVALSVVDATNTNEILRLQAIANCLQEVRDLLEAAITASGRKDGGYDPNKPTAE